MAQFNDPTSNIRNTRGVDKSSQVDKEDLISRKEKPREAPDSRKDFKDVLSKKGKKEEPSVTKGTKKEEGSKPSASIFELSGSKASAMPKEARKKGVSAIQSQLGEGETLTEEVTAGSQKAVASAEALPRNAFASVQGDLSDVNPLAGTQPQSKPIAGTEGTVKSEAPLKLTEIVDQIVERVYTLKTSGQTDTTITLKHPPLLEGVSIKLSAYDSAKGEFNISFTNLTIPAKNILEAHQNALQQTLDSRGFTVHIVTMSTVAETPIIKEGETAAGGREGERGDERDKQDRQQQQG